MQSKSSSLQIINVRVGETVKIQKTHSPRKRRRPSYRKMLSLPFLESSRILTSRHWQVYLEAPKAPRRDRSKNLTYSAGQARRVGHDFIRGRLVPFRELTPCRAERARIAAKPRRTAADPAPSSHERGPFFSPFAYNRQPSDCRATLRYRDFGFRR